MSEMTREQLQDLLSLMAHPETDGPHYAKFYREIVGSYAALRAKLEADAIARINAMDTLRRGYDESIAQLEAKLEVVERERDEWHRDASSHLQALCEKQMENNGLEQQLATVQARIREIENERAVKSLTICRKCGDQYVTTFEYGVIALNAPEPTNEVHAMKYSNDRLREQITALQHENALMAAQRPPEPTRSACGHFDCNEEDCYGK